MIETKLSVSQRGQLYGRLFAPYPNHRLTHKWHTEARNWFKEWEIVCSDCDGKCTYSQLEIRKRVSYVLRDQPQSPVWDYDAGGDTLHTHQASGDPCSVLYIDNGSMYILNYWISLEFLRIKLKGTIFKSWRNLKSRSCSPDVMSVVTQCCVSGPCVPVSVFTLMHPRREHWDLIWNVLCMDQLLSACRLVSICCKFFTLFLC